MVEGRDARRFRRGEGREVRALERDVEGKMGARFMLTRDYWNVYYERGQRPGAYFL